MKIEWIDSGREPQCSPDPLYPEGIDLDLSKGRHPNCLIELPYPAKRCGYYLVECEQCGKKTLCTTAGRADDPRSIRLPCKIRYDS